MGRGQRAQCDAGETSSRDKSEPREKSDPGRAPASTGCPVTYRWCYVPRRTNVLKLRRDIQYPLARPSRPFPTYLRAKSPPLPLPSLEIRDARVLAAATISGRLNPLRPRFRQLFLSFSRRFGSFNEQLPVRNFFIPILQRFGNSCILPRNIRKFSIPCRRFFNFTSTI